jgi:hypothetical protein
MSLASVLTFIPTGECPTTYLALLRNDLQKWRLIHLARPSQGQPSSTTSDGFVSQLLNAGSVNQIATDGQSVSKWGS